MFLKEGNEETVNDLMDAQGIYLNLGVQEDAFISQACAIQT